MRCTRSSLYTHMEGRYSRLFVTFSLCTIFVDKSAISVSIVVLVAIQQFEDMW